MYLGRSLRSHAHSRRDSIKFSFCTVPFPSRLIGTGRNCEERILAVDLQMKKSIGMSITVLLLTVILLWEIVSGMKSGKNLAEARVIAANAGQISQGLEYFFSDQDKFPKPIQFQDRNIMINYFSAFPPQEFPNKGCSKTFQYQQLAEKTFELDFCLPMAFQNSHSGWNKITASK